MEQYKWVYDFAEGSREMRDLLGGKGANVAEMTRVLGEDLVPPGFTITTEACVEYMRSGHEPDGLEQQVADALERLERRSGKRFGDESDPLLVSVRSGARESMPGMLDTILNVGLNDRSVEGLATRHRQRALRLGRLPPPACRCSGTSSAGSRRSGSSGEIEELREAHGAQLRRGAAGRRAAGSWSTASSALRVPAGSTRAAARRRSERCSTRGAASARSSTGG